MRRSHSGSSLTGDPTSIPFIQSPHQDSDGLVCQSHDEPTHPINHIPSELLSEIFLHCASFPFDPSIPLSLSQVCRKWRKVALETPALWDTIALPIPSIGLGIQNIRLVDIFLQRSGAVPLRVDLGFVTGISPFTTSTRHLQLLDEVVQELVPHARRIRVLDNVLPYHLLHKFRLPRLNHLEELMVCDDETSRQINYPADASSFSEALRTLDLVGTGFDVSRVRLPRNLSELYVRDPVGHGQVSAPQTIRLFSALPCLKQCFLDITRQSGATNTSELQEVVLSELEVLHIGWSKDININSVLDSLKTPKLTTLSLRGQYSARIPWTELCSFIKRSKPPLSVLSLIGSGTIGPSFMKTLEECPSLENLTLTEFELESGFFDALTFKNDEHSQRILPKLEYLDFEWCTFPDYPQLVSMLRSRGRDLVNSEERLEYFRMSTNALTSGELRQLNDCGVENITVRRY